MTSAMYSHDSAQLRYHVSGLEHRPANRSERPGHGRGVTGIDPRIASRLIRDGSQFIRITAQDYALRSRKEAA